jgi:hypothetical protein
VKKVARLYGARPATARGAAAFVVTSVVTCAKYGGHLENQLFAAAFSPLHFISAT